MTAFLSALGEKLAEKWLSLLVLPGALYLAAVGAARTLGHDSAFDLGMLRDSIDRVATQPAASSPGVIALVAAGLVAAAAAAGLVASALGRWAEWLWYSGGASPPARLLTRHRLRRWEQADQQLGRLVREAVGDERPGVAERLRAEAGRARARRDRIGRIRPHGPTWIGDGLHAVDQRIYATYAVDLREIWPRLWLVVPDQCRAEIIAAREVQGAAARLFGWAVLYVPVGAMWWPGTILAVTLLVVARIQARSSSVNLTDLVGAAIDLYGQDLARQLGVSAADRSPARPVAH